MSELLTENLADTTEAVDTTTIESTTTETNEHGEAPSHMDDGTLLEEMKKAVKQSALTFFSLIDEAKLSLALLTFFLWVSLSKKVEFYFADANLPYDKLHQFLGSLFSFLC
jgi:hypothetical protein